MPLHPYYRRHRQVEGPLACGGGAGRIMGWALSHLPDLLPITGLRRGAGFNEINNSTLLAKAQIPPLLA